MTDTLLGRLSMGKEVLSPEDREDGSALVPVTDKGESSVVELSPSSCPNEVVDNNAMDAMRHIAFVSFCFILDILCLCFFQRFPNENEDAFSIMQLSRADLVVTETQSHQGLDLSIPNDKIS